MNETAIGVFHDEMRHLELIEWQHYHLEHDGQQWILIWHAPLLDHFVALGTPCFYRHFNA